MKKTFTLVLIGIAALLLFSANAGASAIVPGPMTFNEVFLGDAADIRYMNMVEKDLIGDTAFDVGNRAKFWFDLTGTGGEGRLLNTSGVGDRRVRTIDPSTDAVGYDPLLFDTPNLAYVDFYFSDFFQDTPDGAAEKVRINLGSQASLVSLDFTLEDQPDGQFMLRLDLANFGLLDELMDGQLLATVIAPPFGAVHNTFILDRVELTAQAMPLTAVPIPSAVLLLGSGLIGLVSIRTRLRKAGETSPLP